jgi:hypothetical protein
MSTLEAARTAFFLSCDDFGFERPKPFRKETGNKSSPLVLQKVPVFRSGTFRDSMGDQHTYTAADMQQMVSNFNYLRDGGILPHIPVRYTHPGFFGGGDVIGWHTGLSTEDRTSPHDKNLYTYLLADYEVTHGDHALRVEETTYRNRSAEIGRYTTNSEQEYFPTYMGVAYVDLPAVEGLEGFRAPVGSEANKYIFMSERSVMSQPLSTTPQAGITPPVATPPPVVTPPVAPPSVAPQAEPAVAAGHTFTIGGEQPTDFGAVQSYIAGVERELEASRTAQAELAEANVKAFVKGLFDSKRIDAAQLAQLEPFALSLTAEQFSAWSETWGAVQVLPQLGNHSAAVTGTGNVPTPVESSTSAVDPLVTAADIVKQFKLGKVPKDRIMESPSYKALVAAGQAPTL